MAPVLYLIPSFLFLSPSPSLLVFINSLCRHTPDSGANEICQPEQIGILNSTLLSLAFVIGTILNGASLYIFWFCIRKWSPGLILQFNLALADVLVTPSIPFMIAYSSLSYWPFGPFLCQLKLFLLKANNFSSIYFLTLISIHRYHMIVHCTTKTWFKEAWFIKLVCVVVWLLVLFQGIPFFFILKTSEINNATQCLGIHQNDLLFSYFVWDMVMVSIGYIIPLIVSIICYSLLSCFIVRLNLSKKRAAKMKAMWMIVISLVVFIICCLPIQVTRITAVIVKLFYPEKCQLLYKMENSYYMTLTLVNLNCCLDPLLYWFLSKKFQDTFHVGRTFC
uniref:G-protein coupled receptors family 1 profile domain-containing protein n=1 Tax=Callorhinchus milii TaxID=7868 RepID=A0A4W3HVM6_CALMI